MRVLNFFAENVKKLRVVDITPKTDLVQVTGANDAGKSSVLDSVAWALQGPKAMTSMPVRAGQDAAKIRLDLGDVIVTRRFSDSGASSVVVEAPSGARFPSPQRLLDELYNGLSTDPLAFIRMTPKEQLEMLRHLVRLDTDIDALDAANKVDYEQRTRWNHIASSAHEQAAGMVSEAADVGEDLIDVSALLAEMQAATEANQERERVLASLARNNENLEIARKQRSVLRKKMDELRVQMDDIEGVISDYEHEEARRPDVPAPVNIRELSEQIVAANAHNARVERATAAYRQLTSCRAAEQAAREKSEQLTAAMVARETAKREAIARANMPVTGLSFGDGEVLLNGVPFTQASTAQQLRVAFMLVVAANPRLRVVLIREGSLLDEHSLAILAELAAEHNVQVWIERVDTSGRVGIVIEDGSVVAIDGVPVEAAATAGV